MKKIIWFSFTIFFLLLISLSIILTVVSFKTIRPTTALINQNLADSLNRIVRIPKNIALPFQTFEDSTYFWEMETLDKEVIGVMFKYTTGFSKKQKEIEVELAMADMGDPSIFVKVLPAIISDEQSRVSAQDPTHANLGANSQSGYKSISLTVLPTSNQTIKISWRFDKTHFDKNQDLYQKLNSFPESLLKFLYSLPNFIIGLLGA